MFIRFDKGGIDYIPSTPEEQLDSIEFALYNKDADALRTLGAYIDDSGAVLYHPIDSNGTFNPTAKVAGVFKTGGKLPKFQDGGMMPPQDPSMWGGVPPTAPPMQDPMMSGGTSMPPMQAMPPNGMVPSQMPTPPTPTTTPPSAPENKQTIEVDDGLRQAVQVYVSTGSDETAHEIANRVLSKLIGTEYQPKTKK